MRKVGYYGIFEDRGNSRKMGDRCAPCKIHIAEAPAKNDYDRDAMALAISAVDIMVYNVENFPEWFKKDSVGKQKVCNMRAKRN